MPVNMYGPHDNFDEKSSHVIPAIIKNYTKPKIVIVKKLYCGVMELQQEFIFVEDVAMQ